MTNGFAIGPGQPCISCGRDYGEHERGCALEKFPPAGPALPPEVAARVRDVRADCPDYTEHVAAVQALALADAVEAHFAAPRPHLFQAGDFTLRSGKKSRYKVECDALTKADWEGIAAAVMEERVVPEPFGVTEGVPRGGVPLADAMRRYATPGCPTVLFCEDVVTTGGSLLRWLKVLQDDPQCLWMTPQTPFLGVCLLARGPHPSWVHPLLRGPGA